MSVERPVSGNIAGTIMRTFFRILLLSMLPFVPVIGKAQEPSAKEEVLAPAQFAERLSKAPGTLVDVRTPEEWSEGIIANAVLIDFNGDGFATSIQQVDRTRPVYLYCAVGGRSYRAAQFLLKAGYTAVVELDGGMDAWREAGRAVVPPGSTSNR
jgi:rhodanese-related sulfurtransferase